MSNKLFAIALSALACACGHTVTTPSNPSVVAPPNSAANPAAPTLAAISPSSGLPGTNVDVILTGTKFIPQNTTVEVVATDPHPPVTNVNVESETSLTATLTISADAVPRTFRVVVTTPAGSSEQREFIVQAPDAPLPTIGAFGANATSIQKGATSTLNWKGIANATSCDIDHGVGAVPCGSGTKIVAPQADTSYRFTAIGPGGSANATASVHVTESRPSPMTHGMEVFNFTGGTQTFVVPAGVTQVRIDAAAAQGGSGETDDGLDDGGDGGEIEATIDVTPGETLTVVVGGKGISPKHDFEVAAGGFNGGGDARISEHAGGGGGGDKNSGNGGGGGSSHASDEAKDVHVDQGNHKGNGQVKIEW